MKDCIIGTFGNGRPTQDLGDWFTTAAPGIFNQLTEFIVDGIIMTGSRSSKSGKL